jgi:ABC-2 type transport system permease protein
MMHLLKIEWLKLKNYRTFWILLILYIVAIIGANGIAYFINKQVIAEESGVGKFIPALYTFPKTWNMVTYVSTFLFLFPGLLLINHSCNEFTYKTSRQNIIDGISRKDYITVKLLMAVLLSAVSTVFVFLTGLLWGIISTGSLNNFTENISFVFYFFLQTLLYSLVAVFIAHWVRRSGLALGIYFAYSLILENIVVNLLFFMFMKMKVNAKYVQLFPLQSSDSLIKTPELSGLLAANTFSDTVLIFVTTAYIALFGWLTYSRFLKRDI